MQVELGAVAVDKIFHTAAGYDDMSEERKKLLQKFTEQKEKEEKEKQKQDLAILLAQQAATGQNTNQLKWPKSRGRGGYGQPYYQGGDQQFYRPQYVPDNQQYGGGGGQYSGGGAQYAPGNYGAGQQYAYTDGGGAQQAQPAVRQQAAQEWC
jgi:hypothetical protein